MIKVRLSAFKTGNEGEAFETPITVDETLELAIKRIFEGRPEISNDPKEIIIVSVNGHVIESDLWTVVKLREKDTVLITPKLKSGDSSSLLRTALIIVAAVVLTPLLTPAGASAVVSGLIGAGVVSLATYAAFQLIPPPVPGSQGIGGESASYAGSQMYSISSQANATKKFGSVPRVYGKHRMFPVVAANPYVELEADPVSGQISQYFYAIYDFGFGPNVISDFKIGSTPLSNYSEVTYNLVDLNKPVASEGIWDDVLINNFQLYRGDVFTESIGLALNGNRDAGDPLSDYQAIREAGSNPSLKSQEIILNFILPKGLYGFSSSAVVGSRTILSEIYFSKVGEDNWIAYNNKDFVDTYSAVGGDDTFAPIPAPLFPAPADPNNISFGTLNYEIFYSIPATPWRITQTIDVFLGSPGKRQRTVYLGYPTGSQFIDLPTTSTAFSVGDIMQFEGRDIGVVQSIVVSGNAKRHILVSPLTQPITIYTYVQDEEYNSYATAPGGGTITNTITSVGVYRFVPNLGRFKISAASQEAVFAMVRFTPKVAAEYKIRFVRTSTFSDFTTSVADDLSLAGINTRTDTTPIITPNRHTYLEIKIKATGQINGAIQNLSALCTSVLDVYDPDTLTWSKQATTNPAWVFADILTGQVSKRPLDKSRLDVGSLVEWAEFCDETPVSSPTFIYTSKRYETNFILDFNTTVQQLLQQVAGAAQSSLNLIDGKYGVLLDKRRTVPVQVFTPRNSRDFSSSRGYTPKPHALKVTYVDPNSDWQPNEVIVYDNGYDLDTATEFDTITSFAVTDVEQAFRFGRYFLAQNRLRQELVSLKVDFEYLVCSRGDFVQITQDVMKAGGTPARVISVTGNTVKIDEGLETDPLINYGYVFRSRTAGINTNTLTVISSDTFQLNGTPLPQVGDLIVIGEMGFIVSDYIVKGINPDSDLTATLTLIERADAVYDIDEVDTLPSYVPNLSRTVDANFSPPPEVENLIVTENTYRILTSGYEYFITTEWDPPQGAAFEFFEIYVDEGSGYKLQRVTEDQQYKHIVDEDVLGIEHKFKVLAVSATGKKLSLGEVGFVAATPLEKATPPSDVVPFNSDITNETLQLFWALVPDQDIREYIIKFSPDALGTWETSTVLNRVSSKTDLYASQARTGTYLIKAVDFAGNESATATTIITTIPDLTGLNIIETLNDFPTLPGSKDRVETIGQTLVLAQSVPGPVGSEQYYAQGYYYYQDLLDLGEVYTVRLQSLIQAEGLLAVDIMSNWNPLSSVLALYSPGSSDWDVQTEYRATNELNVMSAWNPLSSIAAISEGNEDKFTEWRRFNIGDATGRIFQFRLSLISNNLSVTPRVLDGTIKADMPDRTVPFNNLSAPDTGLSVVFDPAFKGPLPSPAINISIENGESGDYWQFTSKTIEGFTIVFYDKNDNPVARTFDAVARGYGRKAIDSI